MNKITWNRSYEVGIQEVDEGHRHLLEIINWFEEEIVSGGDFNHLVNIVKDISFSFKNHFENEQKELKIVDHPDLQERKEYHQKFLAQVNTFVEVIKSEQSLEACYECYDYIYNWFFTHLIEKEESLYEHKNAA